MQFLSTLWKKQHCFFWITTERFWLYISLNTDIWLLCKWHRMLRPKSLKKYNKHFSNYCRFFFGLVWWKQQNKKNWEHQNKRLSMMDSYSKINHLKTVFSEKIFEKWKKKIKQNFFLQYAVFWVFWTSYQSKVLLWYITQPSPMISCRAWLCVQNKRKNKKHTRILKFPLNFQWSEQKKIKNSIWI